MSLDRLQKLTCREGTELAEVEVKPRPSVVDRIDDPYGPEWKAAGMDITLSNGVFFRSGQAWTGIGFVNRGDARATVELTAYDGQGQAVAIEKVVLRAGEKVVDLVERVFDQDVTGAEYISYASDGNLAGFTLDAKLIRRMAEEPSSPLISSP